MSARRTITGLAVNSDEEIVIRAAAAKLDVPIGVWLRELVLREAQRVLNKAASLGSAAMSADVIEVPR
jgi:hypothetical protein